MTISIQTSYMADTRTHTAVFIYCAYVSCKKRVFESFDILEILFAVDYCAQNNGGCQHNCESDGKGYWCTCDEGYELEMDRKSCRSKFSYSLRYFTF